MHGLSALCEHGEPWQDQRWMISENKAKLTRLESYHVQVQQWQSYMNIAREWWEFTYTLISPTTADIWKNRLINAVTK